MIDQPRSTRALLDLLERRRPGPALDVGSHRGAVAQALGCPYIHVDLVACQHVGVPEVTHADMLPDGPFGTVWFDAREYDPGLAAETVAQAVSRLAPDGLLITTARRADVEEYFAAVDTVGEALVAWYPLLDSDPPEWPRYEAEFGWRVYKIQSAPGIFSPRRLDEGTRFMLEQIKVEPGARFLDLGCGAGVVSKIASEAWGCQVTAVDVNARALRLATINAPKADVVASDGFRQLGGRQFEVIASNPPYHTDFAVAKAFIEGAYGRLAMGGTLYLVVKRSDWYIQKVRAVFGGCRVLQEGEYTVLVAEKREPRAKAGAREEATATTRKHAKRQALTKKKPRR